MYKIGITVGDINGIGLETIIKALSNAKMTSMCTPVIYGSSKVVSYHKNIVKGVDFNFTTCNSAYKAHANKINVVNCWNDDINVELGNATKEAGKLAHIALDKAVNDLEKGDLDGIVTAPINKHTMDPIAFPYPGHTEYLTKEFGDKDSLMMMVSDDLKVGLATNHLPISKVASAITKELIIKKANIFVRSLEEDFGIEKPSIAILGLNPHAGDDGRIGNEDKEILRPAIIELKKKGIIAMGPYPADGFFGAGHFKKVDGILACYHDQGLVPFKALTFGNGVNYTAGLSVVRTSPDHGTAYDIAGKNEADPSSLRNAIFLALEIIRNRKAHKEMFANALNKKPKQTETV